MHVHIVIEQEKDDRGNIYDVPVEVFSDTAAAQAYIDLQEKKGVYAVRTFEVHSSVRKFIEANNLKLRRSAFQKLSPAERIAVGLTER